MPISYLRPCVQAIAQLIARITVRLLCLHGDAACPCTDFCRILLAGLLGNSAPRQYFADPVFRRVTFSNAGMLDWEALTAQLAAHDQVLCIVNTRKSARRIYEILQGDGVFHLSTLMRPVDRKKTLEEIRLRLKKWRNL